MIVVKARGTVAKRLYCSFKMGVVDPLMTNVHGGIAVLMRFCCAVIAVTIIKLNTYLFMLLFEKKERS